MKTTLRGYRALSIKGVAAIFVTTFALLFVALIVLLAEILFARFSRKQDKQRQEKKQRQELMITVSEFSLKIQFQNADLLKLYLSKMEKSHGEFCAEYGYGMHFP